MRVAVVQVAVTPNSRSANISRLMRMIVRACERDPAPDLLVLPAGCESVPSDAGANGVTRAMGDAFAGLLAMQAREWGVFIAGGHRTRDETGPLVRGVLLDPDGDVLIRTGRDDTTAGLLTHVRMTAIGAVGLVLGGQAGDAAADDDPKHCDVLVVSGRTEDGAEAASRTGQPARVWRALARQRGCHVCVAFPVLPTTGEVPRSRRGQGRSRVYAPDGSTIAQALDRETVVAVEFPVSTVTTGG